MRLWCSLVQTGLVTGPGSIVMQATAHPFTFGPPTHGSSYRGCCVGGFVGEMCFIHPCLFHEHLIGCLVILYSNSGFVLVVWTWSGPFGSGMHGGGLKFGHHLED